MERKYLKKCPLCGAKLDGENRESDLLKEMNELKEKGILQQTMFVAIRIIQSMGDKNPAWLKEALDEQTNRINDRMQRQLAEETRIVLKSIMAIKGSPVTQGMIQEKAIAIRLSALKTGQDRFSTEKSRKAGEDVECLVIEDGREIGKIVIESKNTKKWRETYVEQIKKYMEKESTEFGILATRTLPDDALNSTSWREGVLIVDIQHIEPAYVFIREFLRIKKTLEAEYSTKIERLEVRDQILEELKKAISSGELDSIIDRIDEATLDIENTIAKVENYLSRTFKHMRKDTGKIRELTSRLVSEHIEKIRTQLIQQPLPSFSRRSYPCDNLYTDQ